MMVAGRNDNVCDSSFVKMFATRGDDRKKIEKALEAARIPSGKVSALLIRSVAGSVMNQMD